MRVSTYAPLDITTQRSLSILANGYVYWLAVKLVQHVKASGMMQDEPHTSGFDRMRDLGNLKEPANVGYLRAGQQRVVGTLSCERLCRGGAGHRESPHANRSFNGARAKEHASHSAV